MCTVGMAQGIGTYFDPNVFGSYYHYTCHQGITSYIGVNISVNNGKNQGFFQENH
jgi:hypothetical protein